MKYFCMSHASHLLLRFCLPPVKQLCMGFNPLDVLLILPQWLFLTKNSTREVITFFKNGKKPKNRRFLVNTRLQTVQIDVL